MRWCSPFAIVNSLGAERPRNCDSIPGKEKNIFVCSKTLTPTLGPTQPPLLLVPGALHQAKASGE